MGVCVCVCVCVFSHSRAQILVMVTKQIEIEVTVYFQSINISTLRGIIRPNESSHLELLNYKEVSFICETANLF